MNSAKRLCTAIGAMTLLVASWAQGEITLPMIQQRVPDLDWKSLEQGQVITDDLPDKEVNKAALGVFVAVKVDATIPQVLEQLRMSAPGVDSIKIDTRSKESINASFQRYHLVKEGNIDISWFADPRADGTFNVNRQELAALQQAAMASQAGDSAADAMTLAVRKLLLHRFNEYFTRGLQGISPYYVDGKEIHTGDYLAKSLPTLALVKSGQPDFYDAFLHYPAPSSRHYLQEFYVVTEFEDGRPVTSLKHWMVNQQADSVLIAERKFYISHSLDGWHTLILAVKAQRSTYVFVVNLTFTEKVAGFGSYIAHKVGRSKVRDNIVPLLESIKAHFASAGSP